ncbi:MULTISPECIES: hypothetical protein [Trichocoleus]|uniref:Uncharacterized protein n=1 Tax=Trichocoleus desertorum GB2-A4 TaxID=2933944 RepID=A0ABV0JCT6_9CYAN|nr:hypothetical protein [Trichocoleus sp. FACHB-46]MBD1864232.1 hypothetical protein [Trichocoleus sp. FACHB-46]
MSEFWKTGSDRATDTNLRPRFEIQKTSDFGLSAWLGRAIAPVKGREAEGRSRHQVFASLAVRSPYL